MPLSPDLPPALPPRRHVPIPEPLEEPVPQDEFYDDFETGTEAEEEAPPMEDEQQTYDDFGVDDDEPSDAAINYEFDFPDQKPPLRPSLPERPKIPKIPQEEYSTADEVIETYDMASEDEEAPPPPVPDFKHRKKIPKPPTRTQEKKITPPGGGIVDLNMLNAIRGGLKSVSKEKTEKKEEPKIEKVNLKPEKDNKSESKPLPPVKPTKMNIFKNFMLSKPKEQSSLPPLPPLPPGLNRNSTTANSNSIPHDSHSGDSAEDSSKFDENLAEDEEYYQDAESLTDPLQKFPWYHVTTSREETNQRVKKVKKDGTFLVRKSEKHPDQPYTLVLLYQDRIRNLKIRLRSDGKYALGEHKDNEATFNSVEDLVKHHKTNDVILIGEHSGSVPLKDTPPK